MSIFNFNAISETIHKGAIPNPDWINIPDGWEGPIQCIKIEGREAEGRRVEGTFLFAELSWECMDDDLRKIVNMDHPVITQSFGLTMNGNNTLDLGPNQNMTLKTTWRACGIIKDPSVAKILNQTAWGVAGLEPMNDREGNQLTDMDGNPMYRSRLKRITSLEAAQRGRRTSTSA